MARNTPPPPSRGSAFAASVLADYDLGNDERELLTEAARTLDLLEELQVVLVRDGAMSKGSMGQPVVHPAVAEARQARIVLVRLLGSLGLALADDATGAPMPTPAQLRGRASSASRWGKAATADRRKQVTRGTA